MRRQFAFFFFAPALTVSAFWPEPLAATACALDPVPAATLLLPYFEVDMRNPQGPNTLFAVANASANAILTNVTLWTDRGIPTLRFPLYLTGYDVATVSLRDIFEGRFPASASDGQDPSDQTSPHGPLSTDVDYPDCRGVLPIPNLTEPLKQILHAAHMGSAVGGLCQASRSEYPRGFVTIDTVNKCGVRFPGSPGYFGPGGDATDQNVLWGDFFLVDPSRNFAQGDSLVRIEAAPGRFVRGQKTFYGWLHADSAIDQREPLANSWASRFIEGGAFSGGTELLVWHAPSHTPMPFFCPPGSNPPQHVLPEVIVFFDEQERSGFVGCIIGVCPPATASFPSVANRADALPYFEYGWTFVGSASSWVGTLMSASGRYAVGLAGTPLDSACGPPACVPGSLCP